MDAYEKKDKGNYMKEEELLQVKYNAPPAQAFTSYLPIQNNQQPLYSMGQAGCSTILQSFQPSGRAVPSPAPMAVFPNTPMWVPPQQGQWGGPCQPPNQGAGQIQHQQQVSSQVPRPGVGQVYNPYLQ